MNRAQKLLRVLNTPVGELSRLRTEERSLSIGTLGRYTLDSSRVDYRLARDLYRNRADNYKLGAWPAKPVVNVIAGFMGAPRLLHADEAIQQALDEGVNSWQARSLRINRNAHRDGDVYVRLVPRVPRFDETTEQIVSPQLIPPEWVDPIFDPITGEFSEVVITWPITQKQIDQSGRVREVTKYEVVETLRKDTRTFAIKEGRQAPESVVEQLALLQGDGRNEFGFIPLVHFKNDAEENAVYGNSELEPIEPFMKAYHDVMLHALEGSKLASRPKVQFSLKNVDKFLKNNFKPEEIKEGKLRFAGRDIYLMHDGETASFISGDFGLTGATTLLEFLFYCVVDVSETPEFAFGTAVASSKASVSEQMPVLGRRIERKRGEYADSYEELGSMYLAMKRKLNQLERPSSFRVTADWQEFSPKDDADVASTIQTLVIAMREAIDGGFMSLDAATEFLREFVPSMLPFVTDGGEDDERTRIVESRAFLDRLAASEEPSEGEGEEGSPRLTGVPSA